MSEKRRGKQIVQPKRESSKSSSDTMDDEEIETDETQFYLNQGFKRGECLICYSEEQILIPLIHSSCSHSFCLQCLRTYCTDKLSSHSVPIPCPMGSQCCSTQEADDGLLGASTNLQRKQQTMIHELDLKIIFMVGEWGWKYIGGNERAVKKMGTTFVAHYKSLYFNWSY